jgi:hypothetical protein
MKNFVAKVVYTYISRVKDKFENGSHEINVLSSISMSEI